MVKNFVYIYIVGNLGLKRLTQPRLIYFRVAEVRTKPIFLIHGLYVQGNGTRQTVPFLLLAHVKCTEDLHTRKKKSLWNHMNHSEGFCPTLPFPSYLQFLFKVSRERKPQQAVPSLAQVAYFYPAVNIFTSLFSIDRWLSQNLFLQQNSLQI